MVVKSGGGGKSKREGEGKERGGGEGKGIHAERQVDRQRDR